MVYYIAIFNSTGKLYYHALSFVVVEQNITQQMLLMYSLTNGRINSKFVIIRYI
jgi:hypothetical protein